MKLTRKAFRAWLATQNPRRRFGVFNNVTCPLATYLAHRGVIHGIIPIVSSLRARWADDFIAAVDRSESTTITAARALRILDGIP